MNEERDDSATQPDRSYYADVLSTLGEFCIYKSMQEVIESESPISDSDRNYHERMSNAWHRIGMLVTSFDVIFVEGPNDCN